MATKPMNERQNGDAVAMQDPNSMLEVRNLKMHFPITVGLFSRVKGYVKAVDDVSFSIRHGETLGLVGESGCGKTTVGRCVVRAYNPTDGEMLYKPRQGAVVDLAQLKKRRKFNHSVRICV